MPAEADGPYLVLSDIGVKGERTQSFIKNQVSEVKYGRSLLTEHWNTFEVVDADGSEVWMRQDVYHLKDAGMRGNVVGLLMEDRCVEETGIRKCAKAISCSTRS